MNEKTANAKSAEERKSIRLHMVGEITDYYRTYYEDEATGQVYALTNFRSVRTWNTASCNGGEPDKPLPDGQHIEIVEDGLVISREIISRIDDCTSIGLPDDSAGVYGKVSRADGREVTVYVPSKTEDE